MRIKRAHIYGFGYWIDKEIDFGTTNLVCFFGENETGKSTLQQFILFMLFGLPPRKREFYYPVGSSRMGGRLYIVDEQFGSFMIERMDGIRNGAAVCYFENDNEREENWLREYLKGIDQSIYESVFSFASTDLANIYLMQDKNLGEVLLNIGLTGYSNIYDLERKLTQQRENLFKPYGSVPEINKQLSTLETKEKDLFEIKKEIDSYETERNKQKELQGKFKALEEQIKKLKKKRAKKNKRLTNFQTISNYFMTKEKLKDYPNEVPFPENGEKRLAEIEKELTPIETKLQVIHTDIKDLEEEIQEVEETLFSPSIYEKVQAVLTKEYKYLDHKKNEKDASLHVQEKTKEVKDRLLDLQLDLSFHDLNELFLPFYVENEWRELQSKAEHFRQERISIERTLESLKKQISEVTEELRQAETNLLPDKTRQQYRQRIKEHEAKKQKQEALVQRKKWEKHQRQKEKTYFQTLIGSIIIALFLAVIGFIGDISWMYNLSLVIFIFGVTQYFFNKRSLAQTEHLFYFSDDPSIDNQILSIEQILQIEQALEEDDSIVRMIQRLEDRYDGYQRDLQDVKNSLETLENRERIFQRKLHEQKEKYPFLNHLEVIHWPDVYTHLQNLLAMKNEIQEQERIASREKRAREEIVAEMKEIYEIVFQERPVKITEEHFKHLRNRLKQDDEFSRRISDRQKKIAELINKTKDLKIEQNHYFDQRNELFEIAKVKSREEFELQKKTYEEKKKLKQDLKGLVSQLNLVFTEEEISALNIQELDADELQHKIDEYDEQLETLSKQLEDVRNEQAAISSQLTNLETSETYSKAMHEFSLQKGKLKELAKEWATLKVAEDMLKQAKDTYQKKYLFDVIERMEQFFMEITAGKYEHIFAPSENKSFSVQSNKGHRFTVEQLSRGTIEQLYVSLKLAIGETISDEHRVPFMIDDAFVHFDEHRLSRMTRIIKNIAKGKQILLFTCKQEVIEHFKAEEIICLKGVEALENRNQSI